MVHKKKMLDNECDLCDLTIRMHIGDSFVSEHLCSHNTDHPTTSKRQRRRRRMPRAEVSPVSVSNTHIHRASDTPECACAHKHTAFTFTLWSAAATANCVVWSHTHTHARANLLYKTETVNLKFKLNFGLCQCVWALYAFVLRFLCAVCASVTANCAWCVFLLCVNSGLKAFTHIYTYPIYIQKLSRFMVPDVKHTHTHHACVCACEFTGRVGRAMAD